METRTLLALSSMMLLLLTGCASHERAVRSLSRRTGTEKVWLVSNGFHTSIAVRAQDAGRELRALDPKARFFVIGWGGRDVYMWRHIKPWQLITSVFLPTPSALHVIPIRRELIQDCPNSDVIEFHVRKSGIVRLQRRLHAAFERTADGRPVVAGAGKFQTSRFYAGSETYFFPKTCNMWAAESLQTAGIPITVSTAIAADNILSQGRKQGRVLANHRPPRDRL